MYQKLPEFYDGKVIFLTGAAGFLGTVLLETLLRCFPGIVRIFILLREKKGVSPHSRKSVIFKKRIFAKWCENHPNIQDKVCVVSGDLCLPNLGLNDEDCHRIIQEASIVFHCAAIVSFTKSYRCTCLANAKGTQNVLEFCRKLKKLDVFVYTSTAFSNSNIFQSKIEEKVYNLPYEAQRFLDELENGNEKSFEELVSDYKKTWPNSYVFSKCLAEAFLEENASDLPVVIVRPSIIGGIVKGPKSGYIEEGSGLMNLMVGVGRGFVRVIRADKEIIFDYIPADIVANTHVAAAWCVVNEKKSSPFVINCTSGDILKLKFSQFMETLFQLALNNPLPKTFQFPGNKIVNNKFLYILYSVYDHYLPAFFLDVFLRAQGSKIRLWKSYKFYDGVMKELYFFTSTKFVFETTNFKSLSQHLSPEEKEIIYTDMDNLTFQNMIENFPTGCDPYDWKFDKYSPKKRRYVSLMRTMTITFIKRTTLFLFLWLLYCIVSKVFF